MLSPILNGDEKCHDLPLEFKIAIGYSNVPRATVLVVEDDNSLRQVICLVLRECGCQTLEAANGVEAILTCQCHEEPIDLVISDVVMPHLNGWDLAAKLRKSYPAIKVLMMSGYEQLHSPCLGPVIPREQVDCAKDLLRKPFSIFSLSNKVREILEA